MWLMFRKVAEKAASEAAKAATEAAVGELWSAINNEKSSFTAAVRGLHRDISLGQQAVATLLSAI